jgi:prophage regulatory protein
MSDLLTRAIRDEIAKLLGIRTTGEEMLAVMAADAFIRLPGVLALTGMSPANIYREMAQCRFPRPVVLGPNARAWRLSEIKAWQAERVAARDSGADADMRALNPNIGRGRQRKVGDRRAA